MNRTRDKWALRVGKFKSLIGAGWMLVNRFPPSRWFLNGLYRLYRFLSTVCHKRLADKIYLLQRLLGGGKEIDSGPLSFLIALRSLKGRPAAGPFPAWEEVNRFHPNKRTLLFGLLGGDPADGGHLDDPAAGRTAAKTVDAFVTLLIDRRIEAVSFDLFDTLITRLVERPRDIFSIIDRKLTGNWRPAKSYFSLRIAAEEKARKKSSREEVSLAEIYDELAAAAGLDETEAAGLLNLEIKTELKFLRPRKIGIELLKKAREHLRRIYLVSDTYLGREQITQILVSCGLGEFSEIYISSEEGKTKHYGSLFELFLQRESLEPGKVLHIGDNRHSDRDVPVGLGLHAFLCRREETVENRPSRKNRCDLPDSILSALERSVLSASRQIQGEFGPRYGGDPLLLGYCALGPLLLGFTSHIYRTVKTGVFNRLYFVSRDAYYFQSCYELLRRYDPSLPPSTYLYSSRKLIYLASMSDEDRIFETAERDYFPSRLRDLLTGRFFFSAEDCSAISAADLKRHGFSSLDDLVEKTINHQQLLGLVLSYWRKIADKSRETGERYVSYLRETIGNSSGLLVDIGYSGTLQSFIRDRTGRKLEGLYLAVLDRIFALARKGLKYQAYIRPGDPEHARFFRHVQMFELLLSARHPSVIDVEKNVDGRWTPVYDDYRIPPGSAAALERLHAGALKAAEDFLGISPETVTTEAWGADKSLRRVLGYLDAPNWRDCRCWEDLFFEDSFAGRLRQYAFSRPGDRYGPVWAAAEAARRAPIRPKPLPSGRFAGEYQPGYLHDPLPISGDAGRLTLSAYFREEEEKELKGFLNSLRYQAFSGWTLIVGLEGGLKAAYKCWEKTYQPLRGSVRPVFLPGREGSFSEFTGRISEIAHGWIFFCLPGVRFKPEALAETAVALLEGRDYDAIYFDEIRTAPGRPPQTFFKPDWSPELLLAGPYPGAFWGGRKEVWDFSAGTKSSRRAWLYKQFLILAERNRRVFHLPRAIYEYSPPGPDPDYSPVIQESLDRRRVSGRAYIYFKSPGEERNVYSVKFPDRGPEVAVIIPTRNRLPTLKKCLDSLQRTTYQNYRIYIVDNGSDDPEILKFFGDCGHIVFRIESPPGGFNYSYLNNQAAKSVREDYLLFLNNDTEVINPRWLSQLAGWLQFPEVAAAGGRLIFADGRVQHAGIINRLLYRVLPAPAFKLLPKNDPGYNNLALSPRNCSALTAACLITPRKLFLESGGFDERRFGVAYNDCDWGFRLTGSGYRNVYCPEALLYHHEGTSRGTGVGNDNPAEEAACIQKYGNWADPYYNPNLSLEDTCFSIAARHPYLYSRKRKLRLLFFSHNFNDNEGAPLVIYEIARGLKERGHHPMALSPASGPLRRKFQEAGIPTGVMSGMNLQAAGRPKTYAEEINRIAREISRLKPDVAGGNTILTWSELAAAGLLGIPYLWFIHESEPPFRHPGLLLYGPLAPKQAEAVFIRAYRNVFAADSTGSLYGAYNRNHNISVIHYNFDPSSHRREWDKARRGEARKRLRIRDGEVCVLTPGTFCERKAQLDLVAMIAKLPEHLLPKVRFFIFGYRPSPYSESVHAAINALAGPRRERIEVIPETDRIVWYFLAADILAFPSRLESFPRVIQEAMWMELAIVTTPVFGIREMVTDEVSALFFPPGDVDAFADRMIRILESKPLREKLGRNAGIALGKFLRPQEIIDQYENLFLEAWLSGAPRKLR